MSSTTAATRTGLVMMALTLVIASAVAAIKVAIDVDRTFAFASAKTWSWNPDGPGEVKMARTPDDDPEAMRVRVEPVIVDAVTTELSRRGLQPAASSPDVLVTYYLLLTNTMSSQQLGQFLPATTQWGVPPFPAATQSLEMMNQGSLVLDVSANGRVVWRGVAQAKIKMDADDKRRQALIREAVRDLLRRYPGD
jgi:hypothetical protein